MLHVVDVDARLRGDMIGERVLSASLRFRAGGTVNRASEKESRVFGSLVVDTGEWRD